MAEKLAKNESAFDYTAHVGGVHLVIALVFVAIVLRDADLD